MNDLKKDNKRNENDLPEDDTNQTEMLDFKREMQSAKLADWAQRNQQLLIAMAAAVVLALVGVSLWLENDKSQSHAAATLYHQALAVNDIGEKQTLLETVIKEYGDSGYASLSHLQLSKLGDTEAHLKALTFGSNVSQELAWQARLDLAAAYLEAADFEASKELLSQRVGKQYEQLRHYLLAQLSTVAAEKRKHLQKALDAPSHDRELKDKIESMLSVLPNTVSLTQ